MRIVSWNLGHQTQERRLKPRFIPAIECLKPDVLVLNEYVHGASRSATMTELGRLGLKHHALSSRHGKHNQVLMASRFPLLAGELTMPATLGEAAQSNFLHIRIPDADLEVVGIRVPAYEDKQLLASYWDTFAALANGTAERRIVFVGDFNADPDKARHPGSPWLKRLRDEHRWHLPSPRGQWSFKSGTRIDHVLAAPCLPLPNAEYVAAINGEVLCARKGDAISDHAPIVVELDVPASVS